jgi:hypothetical protein
MAVLGDVNDLSCDNPLQDGAGLLAELTYAYSVTHGDYMVAQSPCRAREAGWVCRFSFRGARHYPQTVAHVRSQRPTNPSPTNIVFKCMLDSSRPRGSAFFGAVAAASAALAGLFFVVVVGVELLLVVVLMTALGIAGASRCTRAPNAVAFGQQSAGSDRG